MLDQREYPNRKQPEHETAFSVPPVTLDHIRTEAKAEHEAVMGRLAVMFSKMVEIRAEIEWMKARIEGTVMDSGISLDEVAKACGNYDD